MSSYNIESLKWLKSGSLEEICVKPFPRAPEKLELSFTMVKGTRVGGKQTTKFGAYQNPESDFGPRNENRKHLE